MKKFFGVLTVFLLSSAFLLAQEESAHLYNPEADAKADIAAAVKQAKAENKNVLLQVGGNWCPWCIRLHKFIDSDPKIDSLLYTDYVFVLVNYSKENKNDAVMKELGNPQRFGFPVLCVLDPEGKLLHIQDTWYLEKDKSYDREKLMHFLEMWNVSATKL